jgi:HEAT repeat protein
MDEQEEVFVTLGRVGNAGTVGRLKKFVEKKSLIQFGKNREQKSLAIRALEHIHSPASLAQLRKMTEDTNNLVQARAKRAYDALAEAMRQKKNEQQ